MSTLAYSSSQAHRRRLWSCRRRQRNHLDRRVSGRSPRRPHSSLRDQRHATYYDEDGGRPSPFDYNQEFYNQLQAWFKYWLANVPTSWTTPARIYSLGVHNDSRPTEAHNAARGFDLARIYAHSGSTLFWPFETYSRWEGRTGSALTLARRRYWATAASLHRNFQNVLTYPYNADHHNHIHVDNLVNGPDHASDFDRSSTAQVLHVQYCLRYVWGYSDHPRRGVGPDLRKFTKIVV